MKANKYVVLLMILTIVAVLLTGLFPPIGETVLKTDSGEKEGLTWIGGQVIDVGEIPPSSYTTVTDGIDITSVTTMPEEIGGNILTFEDNSYEDESITIKGTPDSIEAALEMSLTHLKQCNVPAEDIAEVEDMLRKIRSIQF